MLYVNFNKNRSFASTYGGCKYWLLDEEYHRELGPSYVWANVTKLWFLNGIRYNNESEYKAELIRRGLK